MAFNYKTETIEKLLEALYKKTNSRPTHTSLQKLYNRFEKPVFGEDYLYKRVLRPLMNLKKSRKKEISLNENNVDYLLAFLGYKNLDHFEHTYGKPLHAMLAACAGNWYSYVRCNSGNPVILRSPVKISVAVDEVLMQLRGIGREFSGVMHSEGDCVYTSLESHSGKKLQLVFRLGVTRPDVLQGVFSGVSSAGEPIAGRELLIRQDAEMALLSNKRITIDALLSDEDETENLVGHYFKNSALNILKAGQPSTFGIADLERYRQTGVLAD